MRTFGHLARAAAALGLLVAAAAGTGSAQTAARPLTALTAVVPTTAETLPFFYAQQQGWFEKAGLSITVTSATSGSMATAAVVGGAAQIGSSNVLSEIQAHSKGIPIVLLAPAGQYNAAAPNAEIFVAAASPIKTAKDLEGKTMAVASLHDLLALSTYVWLDQQGADRSKIRFVEMPPPEQVPALLAGRVDVIYVYEPFRGQAEHAGARFLVAPYNAVGRDFLFSVWFANGSWATEHKDAALAFARVMHDATLYTNAHYDELLPLVSSYTKMSVDALKATRVVRAATSLRANQIQPIIDAAAKFHEISAPFPAQEMILAGAP